MLSNDVQGLTRSEIEAGDGPYQTPHRMLKLARRIAEVCFDEETGRDECNLLTDEEQATLEAISERIYRDARICARAFSSIGLDTTTREERKRWARNERKSKKDYERLLEQNEKLKELQLAEKQALVKTLADKLGMKVIKDSQDSEGSTQKKNGKDLSQPLSVH